MVGLLVTLPTAAQHNQNHHLGTVSAATGSVEVINGIEYTVLNVVRGMDYFEEIEEPYLQPNGAVKMVLQSDYNISDYVDDDYGDLVWGVDALIIDLNGYTLHYNRFCEYYNGECFEIWDSSAAGTGQFNFEEGFLFDSSIGHVEFRMRGGTMLNHFEIVTSDYVDFYLYAGRLASVNLSFEDTDGTFRMYGGALQKLSVYPKDISEALIEFMELAPDITVDWVKQPDGYNYTVARNLSDPFLCLDYDYYAVSRSDSFSGAYNYVYGQAWEIPAIKMANLAVAADKTYYVWARKKDGWYQRLDDLHYVDGKLVVA